MFCRNCGKEIPDQSETCPACGTAQTITELEYRTGARSPLGAVIKHFRNEPVTRQCALVLEVLGMLLGLGGVIFAIVFPGDAFPVGHRAMLVLGGGALLLGFGIALCHTLGKCRKPEV